MISQNEFQNALGQIGPKFKNVNINWHSWYMQYSYYESMWNNYFQLFISHYSRQIKPIDIRFVFWESCPGGMPFPHQNYAFDSNRFNNMINGTFDSYLKDVCVSFGIAWRNRTIGSIIIELSQNGILIIDLYPTHGVSLDTTNRTNLFNKLFPSYSIMKLAEIGKNLTPYPKGNSIIKVTKELWNAGINNSMDPILISEINTGLGISNPPKFYC